MGDGSGDSQRVWHEFVGKMFDNVSILDVGAGIGRSKDRLSRGGINRVTTQDINRALMLDVDMITNLNNIHDKWDVVTSFDVIEHDPSPSLFLYEMLYRATQGVFFSTPNHFLYPAPWHFKPTELCSLVAEREADHDHARWFLRHRVADSDVVAEVSKEKFLNNQDAYALGVYLPKVKR